VRVLTYLAEPQYRTGPGHGSEGRSWARGRSQEAEARQAECGRARRRACVGKHSGDRTTVCTICNPKPGCSVLNGPAPAYPYAGHHTR
jgi:hypothetical protein